jgi:hypothetical protein
MLKENLRYWHLNHTLNIDSKIRVAKNRLAVLDLVGESRRLGEDEEAEMHLLSTEIVAISKLQASMQW